MRGLATALIALLLAASCGSDDSRSLAPPGPLPSTEATASVSATSLLPEFDDFAEVEQAREEAAAAAEAEAAESTSEPTPEPTDEATPEPTAEPTAEPQRVTELTLEPVAQVSVPVAASTRAGSTSLFIAEKGGRVVELSFGADGTAAGDPLPILDLTGRVSQGTEQGLLGIAFDPSGERLYAAYTDANGRSQLASWVIGGDGRADLASELSHLSVTQPFSNHNGGQIVFGPDGYLYVGLGDGGGGGDPEGNGQNRSTLLGSILRIQPDPVAGGYAVPSDNPFVGEAGAAPEIWVHGLRNPWRFSFDMANGDLWIGDVGEATVEELDHLPAGNAAGANLGWNAFEGTIPFSGAGARGAIPPVLEYGRSDGRCSVIGGHVYRGNAMPDLEGVYFYSDYCDGVVRGVVPGVGSGPLVTAPSGSALSFGEGADGEIYLMEADGVVSRLVAASS